MFGFYLASSGSELYLGGTNSDLYSGSLEFHDVDTSTGFWQIAGAKAYVNGKAVVTGFETIIDSGTTIMYGPPAAVKKLFASVKGSGVYDSSQGYYYYPCSTPPTVSFSWGGSKFAISSAKYVLLRIYTFCPFADALSPFTASTSVRLNPAVVNASVLSLLKTLVSATVCSSSVIGEFVSPKSCHPYVDDFPSR